MTTDRGTRTPAEKRSPLEWEQLVPIKQDIRVGALPPHWFEEVAALTRSRLSADTASEHTMRAVHQRNRDTFWGIFRRTGSAHELVGYFAFLLLNAEGHRRLKSCAITIKSPALETIAPYGERPDAVYIWGVIAEGLMAVAHPAIVGELSAKYGSLANYTTPATEAGLKVTRKLGFTPISPQQDRLGGLFFAAPKEGVAVALRSRFSVKAVTGPEELSRALAIRSAVFMAEQNCPYAEEFDGNDYCATHLIGSVNGEPAATMRLRYFNDWVKLERMAVLPRFRATTIKHEIVRYAFELARRKGYRQCYGHAQMRLLGFWQKFGFQLLSHNREIAYSDHDYVEIWRELEAHPEPITMHSDPMMMIRPEGCWDEPGILEQSSQRPVTRPC
jgi:predicted GNAT family N-acyltransferase